MIANKGTIARYVTRRAFFVPFEKYYCMLSKNITACACLVFGNAAVFQGTNYIWCLRVLK